MAYNNYYTQQFQNPSVGYSYREPQPQCIIVYTDGACLGNGAYNARAGIGGYFGPNHPWNFSERAPGRQTNNVAEICAAVRAIQTVKANDIQNYVILIRTDSTLLEKANNEWINTWLSNGWRKANGDPVENRTEFEQLIYEKQGVCVQFEHVPAHKGDLGNTEADRLAKAGAMKNY